MIRLVSILSLIALVLGFAGCKKCGNSPGEPKSEQGQVEPFIAIHNFGKMDVELIPDSSFSVEIISQDGLIENVRYEVDRDTLKLYNENKCEFMRNYEGSVKARIGVGKLDKLQFDEPCYLSCSDSILSDTLLFQLSNCEVNGELLVKASRLKTRIETSTSTIKFSGKVRNLDLVDKSFSHINAFDLSVSYVEVFYDGNGIMQVHPRINLTGVVLGSGILEYRGNPNTDDLILDPKSYGSIRKAN